MHEDDAKKLIIKVAQALATVFIDATDTVAVDRLDVCGIVFDGVAAFLETLEIKPQETTAGALIAFCDGDEKRAHDLVEMAAELNSERPTWPSAEPKEQAS